MDWWEIALIALGVPVAFETARRTIWQGLKGMVSLGSALPNLAELPHEVRVLSETVERTKLHLLAAVESVRIDLKTHMDVEDVAAIASEKVLAAVIVRNEKLDISMQQVHHEINNVRQIVMNSLELGSGDRWRLRGQHGESEITESGE